MDSIVGNRVRQPRLDYEGIVVEVYDEQGRTVVMFECDDGVKRSALMDQLEWVCSYPPEPTQDVED